MSRRKIKHRHGTKFDGTNKDILLSVKNLYTAIQTRNVTPRTNCGSI